ncbi:2-succinyl-6-hydroxy-2,4-cyclohexadiene-1-carboxylate synthase [Rodentibacter caecimuris]|uniref:Putative 2-succinyl-6-hydroxy-2,4-cyclohexadiene-1-carboxylate synthase n=1 Tax=Rodentibacter caecimuris TaxID=1796644 RepID=A0ABX3KWE8_9PAST|nr:2-succinyl-6-hydroxy-2,4-cyclohexadiene-1-carboxylate synthase [Rodentibacter heylii]
MTNLIFLHGLLGTRSDWQKLIEMLPHFRCMAIDLPYHGSEKNTPIQNFDDVSQFLSNKIYSMVGNEPYFLIGYSLGGRLALHYTLSEKVKKHNLQAVVLEGANFGLQNEQEKQQRWLNDQYWANRFMQESAHHVLNAWYQQSVFSHLTVKQRNKLIEKRTPNCGRNIGKMLLATSLAKQPDFSTKVRSNSSMFFYFCGEWDHKFQTMAVQHQLNLTLIPNAGHNAHLENPNDFAKSLIELINKYKCEKR